VDTVLASVNEAYYFIFQFDSALSQLKEKITK